jgi:hypothetical protein
MAEMGILSVWSARCMSPEDALWWALLEVLPSPTMLSPVYLKGLARSLNKEECEHREIYLR